MRTRDIDALARLLDGDRPDGAVSDRTRALAALAGEVESRAHAPRPEFREELRAVLFAEASQPSAGWRSRLRASADERLARLRYSARVATASVAAVLALSGGGVAVAASLSVPGDLFYPVKIAFESTLVESADDPATRGTMLLDAAERRIGEAQRATVAGREDSAAQALEAADAAVRDGAKALFEAFMTTGDRDSLVALEDFARSQRRRLQPLGPALDGHAALALEDLVVALQRIESRMGVLFGACCDRLDPDLTAGVSGQPGAPLPAAGPFDMTEIPHASEPFLACPCVTSGDQQAPADQPPTAASPPATPPAPDAPPADPPPASADPPPAPRPPADPRPPLPGVPEAPDRPTDAIGGIIDDLVDGLKGLTGQADADLDGGLSAP